MMELRCRDAEDLVSYSVSFSGGVCVRACRCRNNDGSGLPRAPVVSGKFVQTESGHTVEVIVVVDVTGGGVIVEVGVLVNLWITVFVKVNACEVV